jgi:predicted HTH domain antitoxin
MSHHNTYKKAKEFFDSLKEFVEYVEDLESRLSWATSHILDNIASFSRKDIECMIVDHLFTEKEIEEKVIDLLEKKSITIQRASYLLKKSEEEIKQLAKKYGISLE